MSDFPLKLAEALLHGWRRRLLRRHYFEDKREPRVRLWLTEKLIDAVEMHLHGDDLKRLEKLAEEHEAMARRLFTFHQETIANALLWRA